ncbi:hypothetical protein AHAS_Ahas10G0091800 [Arachis hypogaea]
MSIDALGRLCELLKVQGGLSDECRLSIPGQICYRSGETISRYFNKVLYLVIRVQRLLFAKAVPIPDDFIDPRWKWFKSCLGELDGTYIDVTVPKKDKSRYRARKGKISTNVLESTSNSRVLKDAISCRNNLRIPIGNYYVVDADYTNCKGFLAPYRKTRYHHSLARNIIECCFGLLKKRWAILRSPYFYKIKTQNRIIFACCLLQNFIWLNMDSNLEEDILLEDDHVLIEEEHGGNEDGNDEMTDSVAGNNEWIA